jgi:hypothetical protein
MLTFKQFSEAANIFGYRYKQETNGPIKIHRFSFDHNKSTKPVNFDITQHPNHSIGITDVEGSDINRVGVGGVRTMLKHIKTKVPSLTAISGIRTTGARKNNDLDKSIATIKLKEELQDVAKVGTNMKDADFWIERRGSSKTVGRVHTQFNPQHIGVKVHRTDVILPKFLQYSMEHLHNKGTWARQASGVTNLVNISTNDVKKIKLGEAVKLKEGEDTL